ncbi:TraD/TraG, TraM recognition site domain-containing protein [Desulfonema limicola]|uniref:TraD/TraG, TraM recognition site domain-containing protein n=1 Tax=Desulfonema limicola TaxID=45656 RepID=A0A975BEF4_9BACT|nr:TraM recognition domain-containing protein [Desulfonema limicola]QTA83856.1 TraD/TraG, TraM recognition site domain-containing protein [Desulfonema limicola]
MDLLNLIGLGNKEKDHTLIGYGTPINELNAPVKKIWLKDSDRKGHFFCFGSTRIGKTKLIENMVCQDIIKGYSVVLVDPKGDIELFSKIVQTAFAAGREKDLCMISPIYPGYSAAIDPLAYYYMPEEIVSHTVSGIKSDEEFFVNVAYETTLVIVLSLLLFQKNNSEHAAHINFNEIKKRCSHSSLAKLRENLEDLDGEDAKEIKAALDKLLESPADFFSKISSSLRTVLTSLTVGSVGDIIGKARSNEFMKKLEQDESVILIIQTGSLLTRRTSHTVARVLVSMLQSFVGRRFASGKSVNPPLALYMDEFSNIAYLDIADLFNKAGGAGIWIHAFTQSVADLNAEIGPDHARKILDNTNTKLFMRVNDPETAEYISDYSGTVQKFDPVLSLGGGIMIRSSEEQAVMPEDVMNLNARSFFMFGFSGRYKGRTVIVKPPFVRVKFPDISVKPV